MLAIRLTRMGAKKRPFYRIVVTEKENKRDGRFVEIVGYYNPCRQPEEVKINHERIGYWLKSGAQPTLTVRRLLSAHKEVTQ
ncbi:MAG: 30S ribosomal protein S16 [Blastocatellia bacterium]|nr:30S ribosomal protein S16 [Blastocatellia bacterium]